MSCSACNATANRVSVPSCAKSKSFSTSCGLYTTRNGARLTLARRLTGELNWCASLVLSSAISSSTSASSAFKTSSTSNTSDTGTASASSAGGTYSLAWLSISPVRSLATNVDSGTKSRRRRLLVGSDSSFSKTAILGSVQCTCVLTGTTVDSASEPAGAF